MKEELADVTVYCRDMPDKQGLDEDEIVNAKITGNEEKYPVQKAKGRAVKYEQLQVQLLNLAGAEKRINL